MSTDHAHRRHGASPRHDVAAILATAYLRLLAQRHICQTHGQLAAGADSSAHPDIPLDRVPPEIAVRGVADDQP